MICFGSIKVQSHMAAMSEEPLSFCPFCIQDS